MRRLTVTGQSAMIILASCVLCCQQPQAQETPNPAFRVVKTIVVNNSEKVEGNETAGVVRCKNGDLLATFHARGSIYTIRSKDNGLTWQEPQTVVQGGVQASIGMKALHDGTILLPFYQDLVKWPGYQDRRETAYVYRSKDNGVTWEGDAPIDSPNRETVLYGHILELSDGRLLLPVWGSRKLGERWQVGTLESTDQGKTWGTYRQIAYDPEAGCRTDNGFNETDIADLPDHTLLAILRQQRVGTHAGPCDHYAEPSDNFFRAVSHDLGKTWDKPERTNLIGTSPCLHVTPKGVLMLAYRDSPQVPTLDKGFYERPQVSENYGLGVRVSNDQGRTWVNELHLRDPQGLKYDTEYQPGYPDVIDLPDGNFLVYFFSMQVKQGLIGRNQFACVYLAANIIGRAR
jgi:hypothetical protein